MAKNLWKRKTREGLGGREKESRNRAKLALWVWQKQSIEMRENERRAPICPIWTLPNWSEMAKMGGICKIWTISHKVGNLHKIIWQNGISNWDKCIYDSGTILENGPKWKIGRN